MFFLPCKTTCTHRAPEVWTVSVKSGLDYDSSADVWSLGCLQGPKQTTRDRLSVDSCWFIF